MLNVRNAEMTDLAQIMEIYRSAQDYMIRSGNSTQWAHRYPSEELVRTDIRDGLCKVIYDETGVHGVFALMETAEPTYRVIENGEWLNDDPYVTVHRIASDGKAAGIFRCAVDYCKSIASNIRIDTHADNLIMQGQIEKNGFRKCGTIYVEDGSPRLAYQWVSQEGQVS